MTRAANSDPTSDPTPPAEMTTPSSGGEAEVLDEEDRVEDAVERPGHVGDDRPHRDREQHRWCLTTRRPSMISCRIAVVSSAPAAGVPASGCGAGTPPNRERQRIDEDRERRAHELDEARRRSPGRRSRRATARGELAVPVDDAVDADQGRDVGGYAALNRTARQPSRNVTSRAARSAGHPRRTRSGSIPGGRPGARPRR